MRVTFDYDLANAICDRVAAGESVRRICREAGMPHRTTVSDWAWREPDFGENLAAARQVARVRARRADMARFGRPRDPRGLWSTYTPEVGRGICDRLMDGWTLAEIAREPWAPCAATILNWARRVPEFADAYAWARTLAVHQVVDLSTEAARGVTSENVAELRERLRRLWARGSRIATRKYVERVEEVAGVRPKPSSRRC
jgi:hypothetical protein